MPRSKLNRVSKGAPALHDEWQNIIIGSIRQGSAQRPTATSCHQVEVDMLIINIYLNGFLENHYRSCVKFVLCLLRSFKALIYVRKTILKVLLANEYM